MFGILHFIGLSIVLAYPFIGLRNVNLFLGAALIILGVFLQGVEYDSPYFLWLGLVPGGFYTVDYFPLLPWFGVFLIGIFLGNTFYPGRQRRFSLPDGSKNKALAFLSLAGRHSLLIYLLHQPVLMVIMYAAGII